MTNLFSCGHPHKYFNCILLSRSVCLFLSLQCKLEQQACLTGKDLSVMCSGFCPCSTASVSITNADTKHGKCLFFTSFVFVRFNFGSQHHRCQSSWVNNSKKESYDALLATHAFFFMDRPRRTAQPDACSIFGINTHQFQRLLLAEIPPPQTLWLNWSFNHVLINYLECTLSMIAAKQYWLSRFLSMWKCRLIQRMKCYSCFSSVVLSECLATESGFLLDSSNLRPQS